MAANEALQLTKFHLRKDMKGIVETNQNNYEPKKDEFTMTGLYFLSLSQLFQKEYGECPNNCGVVGLEQQRRVLTVIMLLFVQVLGSTMPGPTEWSLDPYHRKPSFLTRVRSPASSLSSRIRTHDTPVGSRTL